MYIFFFYIPCCKWVGWQETVFYISLAWNQYFDILCGGANVGLGMMFQWLCFLILS